ncbi:threonine/serine exporter family protein [Rhodovulum sulfidophilum]|uniref:threonine/serine exporter family protein n=1 Tax=Rhodovulum sulfidophilum TaxID=35806 RepID=UPI001F5D69D3|nr:threonine/serine exporter family protein [Rhodovulum sulfidophilum]
MTENTDPVVLRHRHLEQIAMTALQAGVLLTETGGKSLVVRDGMRKIALGLGAEDVHVRVGFASLALTVTHGGNSITRMTGTGAHGVNMRLNHAIRDLCVAVERDGATAEEVRDSLARLRAHTPHHPRLLIALAAGIACAAFGRLLGVDWAAFGPVLAAGTAGQWVRVSLVRHGANPFVLTAIVACLAATLAGVMAIPAGSHMVETAMTAAVLLLVPGVPAMNAQTDIMEGHPTTGSARFVTVGMILVFITVGISAARLLVPEAPDAVFEPQRSVLHQAVFGAVAAAGFGVLFNFDWLRLAWAAAAGALALAVRTLGLDLGWSLEAASFAAAASVALGVEVLSLPRLRVARMGTALAVAGCIPMIPGGAATQCIIGLLNLTAQDPATAAQTLGMTASAGLRVAFTIGAIGAGLTIVRSLFRRSDFV